ncbi:response regulator transcription factor [Gracilibacillus phocaeensis]|uniref:response regulator transcription factor n=1 Tax=Gracilibacillus phocaeensis TaxID=2042304 RepID=UPI001031AD16|nr:response regulator transcription factor [Gracilibacillus phocaeensis]
MNNIIRIMIAEDFSVLLEDLKEIIESTNDMQVVALASSGDEAIKLAKEVSFDLVLMDIEMEHAHAGVWAAECIQKIKPDTKVIFLTAHETKDIILTAMGTGAIDYMVKGLNDEEMLEHIRKAYYGNPMLDSKIQHLVFREYQRLQKSEKSLLYFINNIASLTPTEKELIGYLLDGNKIKEIANIRAVEVVTIKSQINRLLKKLDVSRTKEIVKTINELNLQHLFKDTLFK